MAPLPSRAEAASSLVEWMQGQFPEQGFKLHPHVAFVSTAQRADLDDGGDGGGGDRGAELKAHATGPLASGDILLVVPQSAKFGIASPTGALERALAALPRAKLAAILAHAPFDADEGSLLPRT
jgi:hypothetical protein